MKIKYFSVLLLVLSQLVLAPWAAAQTEGAKPMAKEVKKIQPSIIVVPYVDQNGDMRTVLDSLLTLRVAIIKVKEAFNSRGFTTVDFVAKLKALSVDRAFMAMSSSDAKSRLIESSGADIYVTVETAQIKGNSGNRVRLNLVGYDASTARDMGTKTSTSESMFTDQFDALVERAIYRPNGEGKVLLLKDFLDDMQEKFDDIRENGRAIQVFFKIESSSVYDYETEIGTKGDLLKDVIDDWLSQNAYKNVYHLQGATNLEIIYDEVRIPLLDESNRNFPIQKFARQVRQFCNSVATSDGAKIQVKEDVRNGTIYITLK